MDAWLNTPWQAFLAFREAPQTNATNSCQCHIVGNTVPLDAWLRVQQSLGYGPQQRVCESAVLSEQHGSGPWFIISTAARPFISPILVEVKESVVTFGVFYQAAPFKNNQQQLISTWGYLLDTLMTLIE